MNQKISASCTQLQGLLDDFSRQQGSAMTHLAQQLSSLFSGGGQLLLAGNSVFLPVVQLLAGHFTYRLGFDRPVLPTIALGGDPVLAAVMSNSAQRDKLLVRHYRSLVSENHLLLLFSDGSADAALKALRDEVLDSERPVALLSATGQSDPLCRDGVDICIGLAAESVARQLELSLFAGQLLCELVESELFGI